MGARWARRIYCAQHGDELKFGKRGRAATRRWCRTCERLKLRAKRARKRMYQGSPLSGEDVDMALAWHGYAHAEAEARSLDGWKQTVDELHERAMADVSP